MLTEVDIERIAARITGLFEARNEDVWTETKAAQYLEISVPTLRKRVGQGEIPCHQRGGKNYFFKREIDSYIIGG